MRIDPAIRTRLLSLIRTRCYQEGKFTLASGKESDYYLNLKQIIASGEAQELIGALIYSEILDLKCPVHAVGGPETAAIPIVCAVTRTSQLWMGSLSKLEGFWVRREPKTHGASAGQLIEGGLRPEMNVLVVEDVATTGQSLLRACKAVEKVGAMVVAAMVVVDREEANVAGMLAQELNLFQYKSIFNSREVRGLPRIGDDDA